MTNLSGKTALVTGGSRGIGRASTLALAAATVGSLATYAATKGADATLVTHFASALRIRGIRVNGVAPGSGNRYVQLHEDGIGP